MGLNSVPGTPTGLPEWAFDTGCIGLSTKSPGKSATPLARPWPHPSSDRRQLEALAVLAAEVPVGLRRVERLRLGVEPELLPGAPGDVAGVAHRRADVPGGDLLIQG